MVSAVELGQQPPTGKYLEQFDKALDTGGLFGRMLSDLVSLDRAQAWQRGAKAIIAQAARLRWFEPLYVPGLLQTEGHARAVFEAGGLLNAEDPVRRSAPYRVAIVDEAALRRRVGERKTMAEQLLHLAQVAAEHPRVRPHVVPRSATEYPGLSGPFILATSVDGSDVAFLSSHIGGQELDRPQDLSFLRQVWEVSLGEACTPARSIDLMKEVAKSWS
ncbi:transcriptional regulator [Micromonospora sp. WMMC415]|nr:transcriptional regulator [Micromonospora sp. WMMC415]